MSDDQSRPTKLCKKCKSEMDKKATVCPTCKAKQGPGCLVWVIGVFVVLGVIGALTGGDDPAAPASADPSAAPPAAAAPVEQAAPVDDGAIKAGMYKVGTDLAAGEYVMIADSMAYFQVTSDSSGTFESIVCNDNFTNRSYITVSDGQYLEMKNAKAYPTASAPKAEPINGALPEGMYRVGVDVSAGEYKVVADGMAYVEVSRDSRHDLNSIVSNDNFEGEKYVSFKDGQYIKLSRASLMLP